MLTDDPTNKDLHRIVIRANTHKRARLDNTRFSSAITVDLPFREMTDMEHDYDKGVYSRNWLGMEWALNHNNSMLPSLAQIETGLINEAMVQLRLSMTNVKQ